MDDRTDSVPLCSHADIFYEFHYQPHRGRHCTGLSRRLGLEPMGLFTLSFFIDESDRVCTLCLRIQVPGSNPPIKPDDKKQSEKKPKLQCPRHQCDRIDWNGRCIIYVPSNTEEFQIDAKGTSKE